VYKFPTLKKTLFSYKNAFKMITLLKMMRPPIVTPCYF